MYLIDKIEIDTIRVMLGLYSTDITHELNKMGYYPQGGLRPERVINYKLATDEYIASINNRPNSYQIARKYGVNGKTIKQQVKLRGYEPFDYQHTPRFNEHIFDEIDTEEKAYWLGFIFADGYISSSTSGKHCYVFELSLKGDDYRHLEKFNSFAGHIHNNVKIGDVMCNGVKCTRCRWNVRSQHLWETLNSYGCVPRKSLILKFPDKSIFKSEDLIRHFLRGYFDGDGCISWKNKDHSHICISVLSTEHFLHSFMDNLPTHKRYMLHHKPNTNGTYTFSQNGPVSFRTIKFLYHDSTVYLDRKYQRFLDACRLYE